MNKKLLLIITLGLILTGCAEKGMKVAMDKYNKRLEELKTKKKLVRENCLKNSRENFKILRKF